MYNKKFGRDGGCLRKLVGYEKKKKKNCAKIRDFVNLRQSSSLVLSNLVFEPSR